MWYSLTSNISPRDRSEDAEIRTEAKQNETRFYNPQTLPSLPVKP